MHEGHAHSTCEINKRVSFHLSEFTPLASQTTTAHAITNSPAIVGALFRVPSKSLDAVYSTDSVAFFPAPSIAITFTDHVYWEKRKKKLEKNIFHKSLMK